MVVGRSADVAGWRGEHRQRVSRVGDRRRRTGGLRCGATAPAAAPCQRFPQSPRLGSRRYRLSRLRLLPVHHPRRRRQRRTAWPPAGDAPRPMRRRRRAMHTRAVPLPRTQPLPGAIYTLAPPPHPTTVTRHLCGRGWSRGNGWQQRCKAFAVSFARLTSRGGNGWTARRPTPPPLAPPTGAARGVSPSPRPLGGAPTRACTPSMGARWRLAHRAGGAGEQTCRAGAVWAAANLCIARWGGGGTAGDPRGARGGWQGDLWRGGARRRPSPSARRGGLPLLLPAAGGRASSPRRGCMPTAACGSRGGLPTRRHCRHMRHAAAARLAGGCHPWLVQQQEGHAAASSSARRGRAAAAVWRGARGATAPHRSPEWDEGPSRDGIAARRPFDSRPIGGGAAAATGRRRRGRVRFTKTAHLPAGACGQCPREAGWRRAVDRHGPSVYNLTGVCTVLYWTGMDRIRVPRGSTGRQARMSTVTGATLFRSVGWGGRARSERRRALVVGHGGGPATGVGATAREQKLAASVLSATHGCSCVEWA